MKIGITGGKGGTGKTAFAINLAVAISKLGGKAALVDCDPDSPSCHFLLGAELGESEEVFSYLPKIDAEKCTSCGKCVGACESNALFQIPGEPPQLMEKMCTGCATCEVICPADAITEEKKVIGWTYEVEKYGVRLFSSELKPSEPLSEKLVHAVKDRAFGKKENFIYIIDTAAGAHCNVVQALNGCDFAFAVTEPTLFGEHDLGMISHVLDTLDIQFETILNRSDISESKINSKYPIPYDRDFLDCYVEGTPIVEKIPEHRISKVFFEIARRYVK